MFSYGVVDDSMRRELKNMKMNIEWKGWMAALLAFAAAAAFAVSGKEMRRLPAPEFADTEVTAHHRLDQTGGGVRTLDFWLSFDGTPSNNVEVAFGTDADADGRLAPQETDVVIGWECGRYFVERFRTGERIEDDGVGTNGVARTLDWHYRVGKDRVEFKSFTATNETGVAFTDLSATRPEWLYGRDWNLMRMTARGVDVQNERFFVDIQFKGFVMTLR